MSETRYRITWEMKGFYSPTEWRTVTSETDDPWQQYHQLKEWERTEDEPIRNVRLERATLVWQTVPDPVEKDDALRDAVREDNEALRETEEEYNAIRDDF